MADVDYSQEARDAFADDRAVYFGARGADMGRFESAAAAALAGAEVDRNVELGPMVIVRHEFSDGAGFIAYAYPVEAAAGPIEERG